MTPTTPELSDATARPWKLREVPRHNPQIESDTERREQICCALDHQERDYANAALIVTAVNEYEALCKVAEAAKKAQRRLARISHADLDQQLRAIRETLSDALSHLAELRKGQ